MPIITKLEFEKIKEDSIATLERGHPNLNIRNLVRLTWVQGIPFFYIGFENGEVI